MQKIIQCISLNTDEPEISFETVNKHLEDGWKVVTVTAQSCSIAGKGQSAYATKLFGGFVVVIEKTESVTL